MARKCLGFCAACGSEIQKRMRCASVYGADCWWVKKVQQFGPEAAIMMAGPEASAEEAAWIKRHHASSHLNIHE